MGLEGLSPICLLDRGYQARFTLGYTLTDAHDLFAESFSLFEVNFIGVSRGEPGIWNAGHEDIGIAMEAAYYHHSFLVQRPGHSGQSLAQNSAVGDKDKAVLTFQLRKGIYESFDIGRLPVAKYGTTEPYEVIPDQILALDFFELQDITLPRGRFYPLLDEFSDFFSIARL